MGKVLQGCYYYKVCEVAGGTTGETLVVETGWKTDWKEEVWLAGAGAQRAEKGGSFELGKRGNSGWREKGIRLLGQKQAVCAQTQPPLTQPPPSFPSAGYSAVWYSFIHTHPLQGSSLCHLGSSYIL